MSEERKLATVLFADLVGSTELGASQDPERTRATLDRFYDAMAAEVAAAGGTVEKFAGDAVMAAFGAPAAYEDHAERALHAALSMQRRLHALFGDALALRIGVNTGEVVVGLPREGSSFVTGDAVNVAARLEQAAEPSDILVGERTVTAARGAFEFGPQQLVQARGKPEGVPARRLVRAISLMRPRGILGLHQAFVGRERELARLEAAYDRTLERGTPTLVTVLGDAGLGKTRLARELWGRLAELEPEPVRRTGRCLPYGHGITYWALGEVLREHLGILDTDPDGELRRRLEGREILGLTLGLDAAGDLHPLAARDRLHEAWIEFLEQIVAERPAVVLLEDLHWAEPPLLDLVEQLARDVRGPLLIVATARPDLADRLGWGSGRFDTETIRLDPLPPVDAMELVGSLLGTVVPDGLRPVLERAEGNPLYLEETLATLIDRGVLEARNGEWTANELPEGFGIPDSVQAVVAARIDLLERAEKAALQAASVIGRVFWTGPVYDLVDEEPDWRLLEDRDFVRRRAGSSLEDEPEYAFKHATIREVAYDSVPKARRARLHAAIAEWLERRSGGRDDLASLLAHHYAAAVLPEDADLAWPAATDAERHDQLRRRAIAWLRRAGELAMSRYEIPDAVALFTQALELSPGRDEQAALWRAIGRAGALMYDGQLMWDALQRAIELTSETRTLGELYAELSLETAVRSGMWLRRPDHDKVVAWIDRAMELAEPGSAARAKALIALSYWLDDKPAWAVEEAVRLTRELGDPSLRMDALCAMWLREFAEGRFRAALEVARRSFELEAEITDPIAMTGRRETALALFTLCGELDEARRLIGEHDRLSARLFPHQRMHAVALHLELDEVTGDVEAIRDLIPRTRTAVEENAATPCVRNARSLLVCASACAALGDSALADELEAEADRMPFEGHELVLDAPRLRLALNRGDLAAVRRLAVPPLSHRRQVWFYPAAVGTYFDAVAALGDREAVESAAAGFVDQDETVLQAFALRALGIVRADRSLLERAADRFAALGFERQAAATLRSSQRWAGR